MSAPSRSLRDTVVVVTGAGGGIGGATARLALEAGARVVAGDVREDAVRPLLEEFGESRVALGIGDVRLEATGDALVAAGVNAFGRVDSVVANAGVGFYGGLLDVDAEQIGLMIDVNLKGTIWLSRAAVRQFRSQGGGGDIVVIGSVAGMLIGGGKEAVYAATKGAQINLGTAMDRELRGEGIRTTVIAPAGVNTPFAAADGRFGDGDPEHGPFMEPSDIAGAILYTLGQPRRMRTELWTMWSLAENH
jgi:NAD(P)-dependent dehydrogenase (short-subunit alcohol dehydrogenase family)